MDPHLVKCNRCKNKYDLTHFISKLTGKQTKNCKRCRGQYRQTQLNAGTKYFLRQEHYKKLVANLPPCELCGDDNPDHKEFDHIDPSTKIDTVGRLNSIAAMDEEAAKCRCLCKKCHTKVSVENAKNHTKFLHDDKPNIGKRARRKRNHDHVNQIKLAIGGCTNKNCTDEFDSNNLSFYEFDHIDFTTKTQEVTYFVRNNYSIEVIDAEIQKCQLLCGYCHREKTLNTHKERIEHHEQLQTPIPTVPKKPSTKYTDTTIYQLKKDWNTGNYSYKNLATKYNVNEGYIKELINNRNRKTVVCEKTHSKRKYSDQDILNLHEMWNSGLYKTKKALAEELGWPCNYVCAVLRGVKRANCTTN